MEEDHRGREDGVKQSTNKKPKSWIDENLEISDRRRGPLEYETIREEETFRSLKAKENSEIIDSNEFIEILHQPFMVPIDQFQLQIRTKNVTSIPTSSTPITPSSNHANLSIDQSSSISESRKGFRQQNSSNTEYEIENQVDKMDGSGNIVENNVIDHSGDVNQSNELPNIGMEEQEIQGSGNSSGDFTNEEASNEENESDGSGVSQSFSIDELSNSLNKDSTLEKHLMEEQLLFEEDLESNMSSDTTTTMSLNMSLDNGSTNFVENDNIVDGKIIHVNETKTIEPKDYVNDTLVSVLNDDTTIVIAHINKENYSVNAKEIENLVTTLSKDDLILDEVDQPDVIQNSSKYASEIIDNYVISPQYLIQNKPLTNLSGFLTDDNEDDYLVNIVPLQLETSNDLSNLEHDDKQENTATTMEHSSENATSYRFVFPSSQDTQTQGQELNFSQNHINNWINDEQVLVDESGLPKHCADYIETVRNCSIFHT